MKFDLQQNALITLFLCCALLITKSEARNEDGYEDIENTTKCCTPDERYPSLLRSVDDVKALNEAKTKDAAFYVDEYRYEFNFSWFENPDEAQSIDRKASQPTEDVPWYSRPWFNSNSCCKTPNSECYYWKGNCYKRGYCRKTFYRPQPLLVMISNYASRFVSVYVPNHCDCV